MFPVVTRGRYDSSQILAWKSVRPRTLTKCVKFGADSTLYRGVTTTFGFMAKLVVPPQLSQKQFLS